MNAPNHEHGFVAKTRWVGTEPPFYQVIESYRCECGATPFTELMKRPAIEQQMEAARRYMETRSR